MPSVPEYAKDVMIAILGACATLAGLLLVFAGFVFTEANAFPPEIDNKYSRKFKKAGSFGIWPFLVAIVDSLLAFGWLVYPCKCLYFASLLLFLILLLFTGGYGAVVLWRYLKN